MEYGRDRLDHRGEFYGLLLFSILGMNLMVMSRELLTAYIALELLSFSLYVMVAYGLREARSNEAGIKYIIIGALSSAIMLYGLSNIYAALGTTFFAGIAEELASPGTVSPVLWVGIALLVVGLGFKLSAVPFHMWAPDAYEGAPPAGDGVSGDRLQGRRLRPDPAPVRRSDSTRPSTVGTSGNW